MILMSVKGQTRTSDNVRLTSAFLPIATRSRDITPRRRKLAIREFAIGRLGLGVRFNLGATEGCDVFATINKKRFRRL
jgi:hypothetical protein